MEGKILAVNYARVHKVPCLGICLGMQVMVIEYCRSVLGWADANSTEFNDSSPHPVVIFMPEINRDGANQRGAACRAVPCRAVPCLALPWRGVAWRGVACRGVSCRVVS